MTSQSQQQRALSEGVEDSRVGLVVDLDGTLSRSDTLHEAVLTQVVQEPWRAFGLARLLIQGRARFKAAVADKGIVNPACLPLNETVVEALRAARSAGRPTALVSAADHRQVQAVADAVGLFDEARGSKGQQNLKGPQKAAFLTERFGHRGFDYIGNARADIPVWRAARRAITVQAKPSLRRAAEAVNPDALHLDTPTGHSRAMLRALRPYQWSKNVLLLLPPLAAHDATKILPVLAGFLAFCLTASAVYVMNDLIDLSADRAHPRKRSRPFAAGELSASTGVAMSAGLLVAALGFGWWTGDPVFILLLFAYLVSTFAYSLFLKRKLLIDVVALAGLYSVRIIAGGAAGSIDLSPWMIGFSMFMFLSLAAIKRQAELTDQAVSGRVSSGRAYEIEDLPILRGIALSAGQAAVLVLAIYIASDDVQALYIAPSLLWLICPLVLYWILRMVMKTHRGHMTDDPIVFAATDRASVTILILCLMIGLAAAIWPWTFPHI